MARRIFIVEYDLRSMTTSAPGMKTGVLVLRKPAHLDEWVESRLRDGLEVVSGAEPHLVSTSFELGRGV